MSKYLRALKSYWFLILVVLLITVVALGYFAGYRVDQVGITRVGTISVTGLPEKAVVYIDASRRVRASGGTAELSLTPGSHSIIVDSEGNNPWNEIVTVETAGHTTVSPILVPTSIKKALVIGADQEKAITLARSVTLPTKQKPLTLASGCASLYASGGRVIAEATTSPACAAIPAYLSCAPKSAENPSGGCAPTLIFTPSAALRAIIPFPGRQDALIVWAGNLVYAVEIDPREPQFFAPIFKGSVTGLAPWSTSSVVVTNGTQVVELPL